MQCALEAHFLGPELTRVHTAEQKQTHLSSLGQDGVLSTNASSLLGFRWSNVV